MASSELQRPISYLSVNLHAISLLHPRSLGKDLAIVLSMQQHLPMHVRSARRLMIYNWLSALARRAYQTVTELYLYTHIPSTGGVSFERWVFQANFTADQIYTFSGWKRFLLDNHDRHRVVWGHMPYGGHMRFPFRKVAYCALLREPADRVVSQYYHAKGAKHEDYTHPDYHIANSMSLLEFARIPRFRNVQASYIAGIWSCLGVSSRIMRDLVARHTEQYRFIGIMEEWDKCVRAFCEKEQLIYSPTTQKNATNSRPKLSDVDPDTLSAVQELNSLDMELYATVLKSIRH